MTHCVCMETDWSIHFQLIICQYPIQNSSTLLIVPYKGIAIICKSKSLLLQAAVNLIQRILIISGSIPARRNQRIYDYVVALLQHDWTRLVNLVNNNKCYHHVLIIYNTCVAYHHSVVVTLLTEYYNHELLRTWIVRKKQIYGLYKF